MFYFVPFPKATYSKWGEGKTLITHREDPEEEGVKLPHVACDVCQVGIKLLQVADEGAKVLSYVHSALLVCQNVLQIGGSIKQFYEKLRKVK